VYWGENRRKLRRLVVQDNDSLIAKAKAACTSKARTGINSILPVGRKMFSHCLESRASAHITGAWKEKHRKHKCLLLLNLSLSFYC